MKVQNIIVRQRRKNRRNPQNIFTWIRERISPFCFGVKSRAGHPVHCNKNAHVLAQFLSFRLKLGSWYLRRLSNADMIAHCDGRKTFYFTADGRFRTNEVLINIDIDCHGSGTLKGAVAFAEHLRATRFPGLYYETSTNGNGVHGYIVVIKYDLGDQGLNDVLGRLDRWLKAELKSGDWDVENVEVKGQSPVFGWGPAKYELLTYRSGQLAKLPREAKERAAELMATTRVTVSTLRRLRISEARTDVSSLRIVSPEPAREPEPTEEETAACDSAQVPVSCGTKREIIGSITGCHFGDDELAKLQGTYLDLARELLGGQRLVATGRKVVTEEDLAIFLMLLRFFTSNRNADGSLPTARWRDLWTALHEAGDIERPWCHHRYAAMRNHLSGKGLLTWEDPGYLIGGVGNNGQYIAGQAAKWCASEELMKVMEELDRGEDEGERGDDGVVEEIVVAGSDAPDHGRGAPDRGSDVPDHGYDAWDWGMREGEERNTLYGCNPTDYSILSLALERNRLELEILKRLGIDFWPQRPEFRGHIWDNRRSAA
jgi:hypothetical protein